MNFKNKQADRYGAKSGMATSKRMNGGPGDKVARSSNQAKGMGVTSFTDRDGRVIGLVGNDLKVAKANMSKNQREHIRETSPYKPKQ